MRCNSWQVCDLDCDFLLWLVKDCMTMEGDVVDVLQVFLLDELLYCLREEF